MKKSLIASFILASMLLSFAACDNGDTSSDEGKDTVEVTGTLPAGIERKNYDNANINILLPNWGLYPNYFYAEENSGDAMQKALYNREIKVEDYLGVDITHQLVDDVDHIPERVREGVMVGDDLYQIALTHCISGVSPMATEGLLHDLYDIDSIDTTTAWWNQSAMTNLSMAGHAYYAANDYMIPDPNAIVFNKDFIDKYDLDDPYEMVRDGEWTIDNMLTMMSVVSADDGDGVPDIEDTYGLGLPHDWFLTPFVQASGVLILDKTEDDLFEVAFQTSERTYKMVEKLEKLFKGSDTYVYEYRNDFDSSSLEGNSESLNITKNRTLFGVVALNALNRYRNVQLEFGLLPYPKLDKEQDDYISLDWSGLMCVPSSVKEKEMVGEVMELLAYYSSEEVLPAYYDIVLGEKLSRDEDSKEMLDIIFDGIVYDAGMNFFGYFSQGVGMYYDVGDNIVSEEWGGLASYVATYELAANTEIDNFNETILDME